MAKENVVAVLFLFVVIIAVILATFHVENRVKKEQAAERMQDSMIDGIQQRLIGIDLVNNWDDKRIKQLQAEQVDIEKYRLEWRQDAANIAEDTMKTILNYQPVAYCLITPTDNGNVDLACRNTIR